MIIILFASKLKIFSSLSISRQEFRFQSQLYGSVWESVGNVTTTSCSNCSNPSKQRSPWSVVVVRDPSPTLWRTTPHFLQGLRAVPQHFRGVQGRRSGG